MSKVVADIYDYPDTAVGIKFRLIEESLSCPICKDFIDNPQSLSCGHTFCSLCIRKHMDLTYRSNTMTKTVSDTCPTCHHKQESGNNVLQCNRHLASVLDLFRAARDDLLRLLTFNSNCSMTAMGSVDSGCGTTFNTVRGEVLVQPKFLAHKNFHKMSRDKVKQELAALCKSLGGTISLEGSIEELARKYREIVHLNNAQIGSLRPLSSIQVVMEVNKRQAAREREMRKLDRPNRLIQNLKQGKTTDGMKDTFRDLIKKAQDARTREIEKNASIEIAVGHTTKRNDETRETDGFHGESVNNILEPLQSSSQDAVAAGTIHSSDMIASSSSGLSNFFEYKQGIWRVAFCHELGRPFFFNTATNMGQFRVPEELLLLSSAAQKQQYEGMKRSSILTIGDSLDSASTEVVHWASELVVDEAASHRQLTEVEATDSCSASIATERSEKSGLQVRFVDPPVEVAHIPVPAPSSSKSSTSSSSSSSSCSPSSPSSMASIDSKILPEALFAQSSRENALSKSIFDNKVDGSASPDALHKCTAADGDSRHSHARSCDSINSFGASQYTQTANSLDDLGVLGEAPPQPLSPLIGGATGTAGESGGELSSVMHTANDNPDGSQGGSGDGNDDGHQVSEEYPPPESWQCLFCTFINPTSGARCEVCESPRDRVSLQTRGAAHRMGSGAGDGGGAGRGIFGTSVSSRTSSTTATANKRGLQPSSQSYKRKKSR